MRPWLCRSSGTWATPARAILAGDGDVYGVDHGLTFHVENKLRTVLWGWAGLPLTDEARAALVDHLVAQGYRRIAGLFGQTSGTGAVVGRPPSAVAVVAAIRWTRVRAALQAAGVL